MTPAAVPSVTTTADMVRDGMFIYRPRPCVPFVNHEKLRNQVADQLHDDADIVAALSGK